MRRAIISLFCLVLLGVGCNDDSAKGSVLYPMGPRDAGYLSDSDEPSANAASASVTAPPNSASYADNAVIFSCQTDSDCPTNQYCSSTNTCLPLGGENSPCTTDDDCTSGPCDQGVCRAVGLASCAGRPDGAPCDKGCECRFGQCNYYDFMLSCANPCATDDDCNYSNWEPPDDAEMYAAPVPEHCLNGYCKILKSQGMRCFSDNQCRSGICEAVCFDSGCGELCMQEPCPKFCVQPCGGSSGSSLCGFGECNLETGRCGNTNCFSNADCDDQSFCFPVVDTSQPNSFGEPGCQETTDSCEMSFCVAKQSFFGNSCQFDGMCLSNSCVDSQCACTSDEHCNQKAASQVCNLVTERCEFDG